MTITESPTDEKAQAWGELRAARAALKVLYPEIDRKYVIGPILLMNHSEDPAIEAARRRLCAALAVADKLGILDEKPKGAGMTRDEIIDLWGAESWQQIVTDLGGMTLEQIRALADQLFTQDDNTELALQTWEQLQRGDA